MFIHILFDAKGKMHSRMYRIKRVLFKRKVSLLLEKIISFVLKCLEIYEIVNVQMRINMG